jgi:hypothetical protein
MTCYHASIASALALRIISYDKCLTLLHLPVHILHTPHAYARRFTVRAVLRCAGLLNQLFLSKAVEGLQERRITDRDICLPHAAEFSA